MNKKRGFTLAELSVVLALIGIVVALTVTFTTMLSNRAAQSQAYDKVLQDLPNIEFSIKSWLTHYDNADFYLKVEDDGHSLAAYDIKGTTDLRDDVRVSKMHLSTDGSTLVGDDFSSMIVHSVQSLNFTITSPSSTNRRIVCTIEYLLPGADEPETMQCSFATRAQGSVAQG